MAVLKSRAPLMSLTLRQCRKALGLSQAQLAAELGVPLETYRTWDSGRRQVRPEVLARANACALRHDPHALLPLETLALLIHVHVRTLHAAAKDSRLRVTYDTRTTFRRLRTRATLADAEYFLHAYFEPAVWPTQRPAPLSWHTIPPDCAGRIRNLRQRLGMTQAEFAAQVGAARKAVVYQWESQKRCPSPLFWQRIQDMEAGSEIIAARAGDN
jgi:DNA-binding transcriptional regulator YiaG